MKTNTITRKNIIILLTLLFPLFFSANAQTPKEIMQSMYDFYVSGEYKEALIWESQHSTANYRNYDFEEGAKELKDRINGMGGIKEFKILDDFESAYNVSIKARVFYGDGGVVESIYNFRKEKKKWKVIYGRTKVRVIEKGTSETIEPATEYSSVKKVTTDVLKKYGSRSFSFLGMTALSMGFIYIVSGENVLLGWLILFVLIAIPVAAYFLLSVFNRIDAKYRIRKNKIVLYIPIASAALGALSAILGNNSISIMFIALLVGAYIIIKSSISTKDMAIRIASLCLFSFYGYLTGTIAVWLAMIVLTIVVSLYLLKGLASPSSSRGGSGSGSGSDTEEEKGLVSGVNCERCRYYPGNGGRCVRRSSGPAYVTWSTNACRSGQW